MITRKWLSIAASGFAATLIVSGCTASGTAERNALYGAAAGAAAGAIAGEVIAGRPGQGAAIGAGVGAVTGAVVGCNRAGDCFGRAKNHNDRRYDRYEERYYYVDPETNDTYWEDGTLRGRGRPNRRRNY